MGATPPADTTGAIGPTRYIQVVNSSAGIIDRAKIATETFIAVGTLNELGNIPPLSKSSFSTDPQVIWDPTSNRFYYTAVFARSPSDHKLGWGFSRTASPNNVTTDWCHYALDFGTVIPDFPKLGDSRFFIIIGVDRLNPGFSGAELIAIRKPPTGTVCPAMDSFKIKRQAGLTDTNGFPVTTLVPAIQVDTLDTGYVIARNGTLPSTQLWFFNVTRNPKTEFAEFSRARGLTVAEYNRPPLAQQFKSTRTLATHDGRMTQAVQAFDPRTHTFSFWTQHTSTNPLGGSAAAVRWYEIDPVPAKPCDAFTPDKPCLVNKGVLGASIISFYNGAISSDRRCNAGKCDFGDSFVIDFNVSSTDAFGPGFPSIGVAASHKGGPVSIRGFVFGVAPYQDISCVGPTATCKWGDYSSVVPDPVASSTDTGIVWGTNHFSGKVDQPLDEENWLSQIFTVKP